MDGCLMIRDLVRSAIDNRPDGAHVEARYHQRLYTQIRVDKGRIHTAAIGDFAGIGVRVLADGAWGYASTSRLEKDAVSETLDNAYRAAKNLAGSMKEKIELASIEPVTGIFKSVGKDPFSNHEIEEWVDVAVKADKEIRDTDEKIKGSLVAIREPRNHRIVMNSDGTEVELFDSRPSVILQAVASEAGKVMPYMDTIGINGGWEIFEQLPPSDMVKKATDMALKLLNAPMAKGGRHPIVMSPGVVGIICHEAIGHTAEADIVMSGSAAADKIGEKVASEHVTMVDSGEQETAAGWLAVDDAGVAARRTVMIEKGIMKSFLHSRYTAHHFGVEPTGNERAFEYDVEPLIRMRNTYLEPGDFSQEELIEDVKFGYLCMNPGGGQADSSAEFMFTMPEAYIIENGEVGGVVRNMSLTGNAFEVLMSVDGVGKDWKLDMGAGHCGKGQLMKVDGGGGSTRAVALVAGDAGGV
ncbi:MAG: TldD/PmbA family protein [Candidatus Thorarchaeota archaeon]